jgi:hypothetical protein
MKKYTQEQIDEIPNILKSYWNESWIKEQNKPTDYLGKLAILIKGKKIGDSHWITEGVDFKIIK